MFITNTPGPRVISYCFLKPIQEVFFLLLYLNCLHLTFLEKLFLPVIGAPLTQIAF